MALIESDDYISLGYFQSLTNRNAQTIYRWHYGGKIKSVEMRSGDDKSSIFIHKSEVERCFKPKNGTRCDIEDPTACELE